MQMTLYYLPKYRRRVRGTFFSRPFHARKAYLRDILSRIEVGNDKIRFIGQRSA